MGRRVGGGEREDDCYAVARAMGAVRWQADARSPGDAGGGDGGHRRTREDQSGLAVLGRRTDGYHKLVTLMATLDLADTVRVEDAADVSLICDDPALATDDNLALRAARLFGRRPESAAPPVSH